MKTICLTILLASAACAAQAFNPFASAVIDISENPGQFPAYRPAPGQYLANSSYNDPNRALGAPSPSAGTNSQDNASQVSLGGFGGQLVLGFDHDVLDSPANPMGLDAIVFGNAAWVWNDPQYRWAEPVTLEIMPEVNGSGVPGDHPDERWYLIPGSDLTAPGDYRETTYTRDGRYPPLVQYPTFADWPDSYSAGTYELHPNYQTLGGLAGVIANANTLDADPNNDTVEAVFGYGDYSPTAVLGDRDGDNLTTGPGDAPSIAPELFYTTPDDPHSVGLTAGAGGGDAFDIAWAVDPTTFAPANLPGFRYIRLTGAVDLWQPEIGEISGEIDAVADVRMTCDLDGDDRADLDDYLAMRAAMGTTWTDADFAPAADIVADAAVDPADWDAFWLSWVAIHPPGDANLDGRVDDADYTLWADNYGRAGADWSAGDFNADGRVDDADYTLWADNYGLTGYNTPAPATLLLLAPGAAAVLRRTRRA